MGTDDNLQPLWDKYLECLAEGAHSVDDQTLERVWDAAGGRVSPERTRELLDELFENPSLVVAWTIARKLQIPSEEGESEITDFLEEPKSKRWSKGRAGWLAAAALLVGFAGLALIITLRQPSEPVYRGSPDSIQPLLPDNTELPRSDAALRWQRVPEAKYYNLRILRTNFDVLLFKEGLNGPLFVIPEEELSDIIDGEELLWQVEAVFPDGSRELSALFHVTIQENRPAQEGE